MGSPGSSEPSCSATLSPPPVKPPAPAEPRGDVYSPAHRPFRGRHPSLVALGVPGVPVARGQAVHQASAPLGLQDPGRSRGHRLGGPASRAGLRDTQSRHAWARLVALTPTGVCPTPAHMLLVLGPKPPQPHPLVPGMGGGGDREEGCEPRALLGRQGPEAPTALGPLGSESGRWPHLFHAVPRAPDTLVPGGDCI